MCKYMSLNIYLNHLHPHLNGKVHLFVKIIFYNKTLFQLKQVRSFYLKFSCGKLRTLTGFDINNKKDFRKKIATATGDGIFYFKQKH